MTSSPYASWHELPRSTKSECPKLFYALNKEADSLTVRLTDLVGIWQCCLDRDDIVASAREQRASIDPSESSIQLRVLLDRLEQSIQSGRNFLCRDEDEDAQVVHLQTSISLPKPLKPLFWTFKLDPQGTEELAEQILRPCLHEASIAKQKLDSLFRVIKDKDHVSARLLEKIESLGTDLSLIFPGITGLKSRKGRATVQEARKHVPGIVEFDQDKWSRGFDNSSPYAGFDDMGMGSLVAGCERCPKHTVKQHNDWLSSLPITGGQAHTKSPGIERSALKKTPEPSPDDNSVNSQSDFETQPAPPHLKKRAQTRKTLETSSTADEEDSRPSKKPKLGRLGEQDRHNKLAEPESEFACPSDPERQPSPKLSKGRHYSETKEPSSSDSETETASEADSPPRKKSPLPPSPQRNNITTGLRKLGRLNSGSSSLSHSRSVTPAVHVEKDPLTLSQRSAPQKPTIQQPHSPSEPLSPPQRKGRLGSLRRSESAQQHDSKPGPTTRLNTKTTRNSPPPPRPAKSRSASTSNPSTPRKLGRLKQSQQAGSRSNTTSVEPNTPSKTQRHTSPSGAKDHPETGDRSGSATATDSEVETKHHLKRNPCSSHHHHHHHSQIDTSFTGSESDANTHDNPSPPAPEPPKPPVKKETVEEAANRRREELKQKLNTGAGGGAGRKKRKF